MYIAQWIAKHSSYSRRSAIELVKEGRVAIDGRPAHVTDNVSDASEVTLDGKVITPTPLVHLMLHKPVGYICSKKTQDGRPTVYELLPEHYRHLTYAGRLDVDSSGLLLMSNDGAWIQELTHPRHELKRIYHVELDRALLEEDAQQLREGVMLDDGESKLTLAGKRKVWRVELHEGRNRQIRRTFGALGYRVKKLHRTQHGSYRLGTLATGDHKEINRYD